MKIFGVKKNYCHHQTRQREKCPEWSETAIQQCPSTHQEALSHKLYKTKQMSSRFPKKCKKLYNVLNNSRDMFSFVISNETITAIDKF